MFFNTTSFSKGLNWDFILAKLADGEMKPFGKLLTKFNLEKPGKLNFLSNHAMIKTWKLMKKDLEKPGVRPLWENGDPDI